MYVVEIRSTFQNYRQPQKSNQESTTLKPKYYHQQKRRMLEDLVDPSLLNKFGGTLQVINSTLHTFFVSRNTKMKILSYHLNHSYISQVPLQGISGRRPKSAYELLSSAADPPRRSKNYPLTSGYQTSYTPYVPYR